MAILSLFQKCVIGFCICIFFCTTYHLLKIDQKKKVYLPIKGTKNGAVFIKNSKASLSFHYVLYDRVKFSPLLGTSLPDSSKKYSKIWNDLLLTIEIILVRIKVEQILGNGFFVGCKLKGPREGVSSL